MPSAPVDIAHICPQIWWQLLQMLTLLHTMVEWRHFQKYLAIVQQFAGFSLCLLFLRKNATQEWLCICEDPECIWARPCWNATNTDPKLVTNLGLEVMTWPLDGFLITVRINWATLFPWLLQMLLHSKVPFVVPVLPVQSLLGQGAPQIGDGQYNTSPECTECTDWWWWLVVGHTFHTYTAYTWKRSSLKFKAVILI